MKRKGALREAAWTVLALVGMSMIFVTVVGYFDEGNHLIYAGFWDYLTNDGAPPMSDYILWAVIFVALGVTVFQAQGASAKLRDAFVLRLTATVFAIPVLVLGFLLTLMAAV